MLAPLTNTGTVDIRKYIYDKLKSYVNLTNYIGGVGQIKCRELESISKMQEPFISYSETSDKTNNFGIRTIVYQITAWGKTIKEMNEIKDLIIELFNRNSTDNVKSNLVTVGPDLGNPKGKVFHKPLVFQFVVKDQKF